MLVPTTSPQPKTITPNPHSPNPALTLHPVYRIRQNGRLERSVPAAFQPLIPACHPFAPHHSNPSTTIVVAGDQPPRFHNLPDRATCRTSTWDRTVQLSRFAPFRLIPRHDYLPRTIPANPSLTHRFCHCPAIAPTAASVLFPPSSHGAKSIIRKTDYFPPAYLRHTTGIAHPKPILRIILSLMLKPYAQIIRYCK